MSSRVWRVRSRCPDRDDGADPLVPITADADHPAGGVRGPQQRLGCRWPAITDRHKQDGDVRSRPTVRARSRCGLEFVRARIAHASPEPNSSTAPEIEKAQAGSGLLGVETTTSYSNFPELRERINALGPCRRAR